VFGDGEYTPASPGGQRLLAHELTHVTQQASGPVEGTRVGEDLSISHPADRFERHAAASAADLTANREAVPTLPRQLAGVGSRTGRIHVQRDAAADVSAGAGVASAGVGGISALFAGIGLVAAFDSAKQAKRQAKAAEEQTEESKKQTGIAGENLDVAKQQLAVSENPPAPAPTTGGIVVNNNSGYADIPSVPAPKGSSAPKAEAADDKTFTVLKVSQGDKNFANFNAVVKSDGREIKGGYLQDGDAQGYLGGSAASNLNLTLKPIVGAPAPYLPQEGKPSTVASVKVLISGNNIAPRTKSGTDIQRFSGAVILPATGEVSLSKPFNVNGGTLSPPGDGTSKPAVTIDLPSSPAPAPVPVPAPAPNPTQKKADGGPPPK
jgi:hypothetical protein